jgi:hypothetical protein
MPIHLTAVSGASARRGNPLRHHPGKRNPPAVAAWALRM